MTFAQRCARKLTGRRTGTDYGRHFTATAYEFARDILTGTLALAPSPDYSHPVFVAAHARIAQFFSV
jgi:hypothetical protein